MKSISMEEIFSIVWKYTHKFDKKRLQSFTKQKLDFLSAELERKAVKSENQKIRFRFLSVLSEEHHGNAKRACMRLVLKFISDYVANNIINVLPGHQANIRSLKEDGWNVIGYCRKSDLPQTENFTNILQHMVDNHYRRSLVEKVFVSPSSNAGSSFSERDLQPQNEAFDQLQNVHGNTKGKL